MQAEGAAPIGVCVTDDGRTPSWAQSCALESGSFFLVLCGTCGSGVDPGYQSFVVETGSLIPPEGAGGLPVASGLGFSTELPSPPRLM